MTTTRDADGRTGGSASSHATSEWDAAEDAYISSNGVGVVDAAGGSSQQGAIHGDTAAGTGGVGGSTHSGGDEWR